MSRYQVIATCLFVGVKITNGVAVSNDLGDASQTDSLRPLPAQQSDDKWIHPHDNSTRSHQALNMSDVARIVPIDEMPRRVLMQKSSHWGQPNNRGPPRHPNRCTSARTSTSRTTTDVKDCVQKQPPSKKECTSASTSKSGTKTNVEGCEPYKYTIFAQTWIPARIYSDNKFLPASSQEEADDWNKNLKIHGIWPHRSEYLRTSATLTEEAEKAIDKKEWPSLRSNGKRTPRQQKKFDKKQNKKVLITLADGTTMLESEWRKLVNSNCYLHQWILHGSISGLSDVQYVKEVQRLHSYHATPTAIQLENQDSIPRETLMAAFPKQAFVACKSDKSDKKKEYFYEVRYCYSVDTKTHLAEELVDYKECLDRDKEHIQCTQSEILILHTKVEPRNSRQTKSRPTTSK